MRQGAKGVGFSSSPVLTLKLPAWRSKLAVLTLTLMFVALVAKAFWLQVTTTDFLQQKGASRYERVLEMPAMRGKISDRDGVVVASSMPVRAIWAIPEDVDQNANLGPLARLLGMSERAIRAKLADEDRKFVYLKRQVDVETADKIAALKLEGIHQRNEFKRYYPEGETLSHVVGFTNVEESGQEGIELALDSTLAGRPGSRRVIKDRLGRVVEEAELLRAPLDGHDATLAIDSKIQSAAYAALKAAVEQNRAKAGAALVIDAQTGEMLALANWPSYDPNQRAGLRGEQLRNRVVTDTFEPGSVMKPVTVALALESHVVRPDSQFQTAPGRLTIGSATISDSHAHGMLSVAQIIEKSSNIGTAKIALQMEPRAMWEFYTSVGFGQVPKLGFPGAVAGRLRPYANWRPIEQATMSYGYGISVSLAQIARAYTMFARNGDLIPLSITKLDAPPAGVRIVSPETAAQMRNMLEQATGPGGTAPKAQVVGYRVAGKTGTARKLQNGRYLDGGKYIGSFVGFAPVSNPRVIVAVMIDEPSAGRFYGGDVAAPAFSAITGATLRLLNITPDAPFRPTVIPAESLQDSL